MTCIPLVPAAHRAVFFSGQSWFIPLSQARVIYAGIRGVCQAGGRVSGYVRFVCQATYCRVYARGVCQGCMSGVYVGGVCQGCMSGWYARGVCRGCVSGVCAMGVCQGCVPGVYVKRDREHRRFARYVCGVYQGVCVRGVSGCVCIFENVYKW